MSESNRLVLVLVETQSRRSVACFLEVERIEACVAMRCHPDCPRDFHEPIVLSEAWRSIEYISSGRGFSSASQMIADSPERAPWFRFSPPAGLRLPTASPGGHRCGNSEAGWLSSGGHPEVGAPPTSGTVCFASAQGDCVASVQIRMCTCLYPAEATVPVHMYRFKAPGSSQRNCTCSTPASYSSMPFGTRPRRLMRSCTELCVPMVGNARMISTLSRVCSRDRRLWDWLRTATTIPTATSSQAATTMPTTTTAAIVAGSLSAATLVTATVALPSAAKSTSPPVATTLGMPCVVSAVSRTGRRAQRRLAIRRFAQCACACAARACIRT